MLLNFWGKYGIILLRHNSILEGIKATIHTHFYFVKMRAPSMCVSWYTNRIVSQQLELRIFRCVASVTHLFNMEGNNMEKEKKSKKKIGVIVLAVTLIIILLLCLVQCRSCSGDTDPAGNTTTPTGETTTEGAGSSEPSTEVTTPSEDVTEPSGDATEPSTAPAEPSTEITEPSTEATEPGADTTEPSIHTHSYTETKTAPDCETEGYTTYTCDCGNSYIGGKIPAAGHKWSEWVTSKEPTESSTGLAGRNCTVCGETETRVLDKVIPNHTHAYSGKVTKAATCTAEGVKTYTCSCGSSYTESISKISHKYVESVTEPTCTEEGYSAYKCSACGDIYWGVIVSAKGHSPKLISTKVATCTEEGYSVYRCSVCGYSFKSNYTEAEGHNYSSKVTHATCTADGYIEYACMCGDKYIADKIPATGHSYTSKVTTPATCSKDGVKTYTCSNCSYSYTEAVKSGHSWKYVPIAPEGSELRVECLAPWCDLVGMQWHLDDYGCETIEQALYFMHEKYGEDPGHIDEFGYEYSVGHVEVWLVCRCGWTCTVEDAYSAGVYKETDYDTLVKYWNEFHVKQKPVSDRKNHSYDTPDKWVVDTPASDKWVCTECGKETTTKP